jgi:hypothetical protein
MLHSLIYIKNIALNLFDKVLLSLINKHSKNEYFIIEKTTKFQY